MHGNFTEVPITKESAETCCICTANPATRKTSRANTIVCFTTTFNDVPPIEKIEKSMFPMFPRSRQSQCYGNRDGNEGDN